MTPWLLRDELPLAAMPSAASRARRHAEELLRDWRLGCDAAFVHRVKLVVSELVTNAANATGPLIDDDERRRYDCCPRTRAPLDPAPLGPVRLRLSTDARSYLRIEVGDQSDEPPAPRAQDIDAEDGRGLLLVELLCDGWGWYRIGDGTAAPAAAAPGDGTRKVVWGRFGLAVSPARSTADRPAEVHAVRTCRPGRSRTR